MGESKNNKRRSQVRQKNNNAKHKRKAPSQGGGATVYYKRSPARKNIFLALSFECHQHHDTLQMIEKSRRKNSVHTMGILQSSSGIFLTASKDSEERSAVRAPPPKGEAMMVPWGSCIPIDAMSSWSSTRSSSIIICVYSEHKVRVSDITLKDG